MTTTLLFVHDESDVDMARELLHRGHRIALAGTDLACLFRCAGRCGRASTMIVGDPDDRIDRDRIVARAVAMLGPLDAVVNAPETRPAYAADASVAA